MLLPGKIIVNRTRSALSSAAHRTSCQIGAPVYVQGLTGDKPCILGCQKHRRSGDLVRLRHPAKRDRAFHLVEFRLAAAIARLGSIGEPGRYRVDPASVPTNFTGIIPTRINSDFG
jgi:hypothetical protein